MRVSASWKLPQSDFWQCWHKKTLRMRFVKPSARKWLCGSSNAPPRPGPGATPTPAGCQPMTASVATLSPDRVQAKVRKPPTAADFRTIKDGPSSTLSGHLLRQRPRSSGNTICRKPAGHARKECNGEDGRGILTRQQCLRRVEPARDFAAAYHRE